MVEGGREGGDDTNCGFNVSKRRCRPTLSEARPRWEYSMG
jgi:hypothetical protein